MTQESKIVKFFSIFAMLAILIAVYLFFVRPSQLRHGATQKEVR
jgi:hypothetical protein